MCIQRTCCSDIEAGIAPDTVMQAEALRQQLIYWWSRIMVEATTLRQDLISRLRLRQHMIQWRGLETACSAVVEAGIAPA